MNSRQQTGNIRHAILDRDGVINEESPAGYILSPEEFIWVPGAMEGLAILAEAGIAISIATNQSCVGRGLMDKVGLDRIHEKMENEASGKGIFFAGIHFCPHAPDDGCACRKPATGLIEAAITRTRFSRNETIFTGDAERDLQAAAAAGITPFLVRTGKGSQTEENLKKGLIQGVDPENVAVFDDLLSACRAVAAGKGKSVK